LKIELYLEDPMGGGCGCSSSMKDRMALVKRIRDEANVWNQIKQRYVAEYQRTVVSPKIPLEQYPVYVGEAIKEGIELPFVYIDENLVHSGSFPTVEEFNNLIGGKQKA